MTSECNRYELAISAYMDGESANEETRSLFFHLAECESCRLFWTTSIKVEREALREKGIVASGNLDERVASIVQGDQLGIIAGELEKSRELSRESFRNRPSRKPSRPWATVTQNTKPLSYSLAAIVSLLVLVLGIILGTLQPWSRSALERTEPQVVYVSILPSVTILGHLYELNSHGELK